MNYFNIKEASELLGITTDRVRYLYNRKTFAETLVVGGKLIISEYDILSYKKHLELLDTMYSIKDVCDILGFSFSNLYRHYVKKGFFTTLQKINNQYYITKNEINNLLEENRSYFEMTDYKNCEETAKYLGLNVETVYRYIAQGAFPNAVKSCFYSSPWKIPNRDISLLKERLKVLYDDEIKKRPYSNIDHEMSDKYYTVQQVANYYGVNPSTIHVRIREGLFQDVTTVCQKRYIGKAEVHSTHATLIKQKMSVATSYEERVFFYLRKVENAKLITETIEIFKIYLNHLIGNTKMRNKNHLISSNGNMFIDLSLQLVKELHDHTDVEIVDIVASTTKLKKQLIGFVNFISAVKSNECKYKNKYNYTSKINTQTDKEIYSKKEFKKIYLYVNNIELHREKALSKPEYAETWFYIFMHMTNAWRSSDIINFPLINFSEISQEYIDSVISDGITIAEAQSITNIVSEQWERFVSNKNRVLNRFLVNIDSVQTASTILLAIESHRRKHNYNGKHMLPLLQQRNSSITPFIKAFFKSDPTLRLFSSRIANRSLMTYFFHSVSKGSNNGDVAHLLAQRLRRHTSQDAVSQYVMNTNKDEYLDDTSYNLFRRGHFGWLYNSLVEIVVNKKELKLSQEEKTKIIESYQELYSPSKVEEISSYFLENQNEQQSVALEIALLPDDEVEKRLYSIYMGAMPSKEENSQCFYSENCKKPIGNCKTCPYIIPRTHLMISLKRDLEEIIDQIKNLNEYDINERIRKTHILYKLLNLVSQAIKSFEKEYVNSFIPLKALKNRLEGINDMIYFSEGK